MRLLQSHKDATFLRESTMRYRRAVSVVFSVCASVTFLTVTSLDSLSQSLARTGGGVRCVIDSKIYTPECNYQEEDGTGVPSREDIEDVDQSSANTLLVAAVQQSLSNLPDCEDLANTNIGAAAQDNLPGNVNCNAFIGSALASGGARVEGDGGGLNIRAIATKTYEAQEPLGGLTGNEVLVFHGVVSIGQVGDATFRSAGASGPGISISVNSDLLEHLTGTVTDVLTGTETHFSAPVSSGITMNFSQIVQAGEFTIITSASSGESTLSNGSIQAVSNAVIGGQLDVIDASLLPAKTLVYVTQ